MTITTEPNDLAWIDTFLTRDERATSPDIVAAVTHGNFAMLIDATDWPVFAAAVAEAAAELATKEA